MTTPCPVKPKSRLGSASSEYQAEQIRQVVRQMQASLRIAGVRVITVPDDATVDDCLQQIISSQFDKHTSDAWHMFSLSSVLYKWRHWFNCMPTVHPFYAVKANPDPVLLRLLAMLGANFDCASRGEIDLVLSMDVTAERIIFANTMKPIISIIYAKNVGVDLFTVDSEDELIKFKEHFSDARLILRIRIGDPTALVLLNKKFGCEPETEAPTLVKRISELSLRLVGISFHVGGGCNDPTIFERAIGHARRLFDFAKTCGHEMYLLDIGGGYPGYCNENVSLYKIGQQVNMALGTYFGDWPDITVISEPGRYFAMPSACAVAQVFGKKAVAASDVKANLNNEDKGFMYYITDGVFGTFNCTPVYRIRPPFIVLGKDISANGQKLYPSRIWGPTCDSADLLFPFCEIPELQIGDWLVFQGMGAYGSCIASEFNGFPRPKTFYVLTGSDKTYVSELLRKQRMSISQHQAEENGTQIGSDYSESDDNGSITNMVFAGKTSRVLRASTSIAIPHSTRHTNQSYENE